MDYGSARALLHQLEGLCIALPHAGNIAKTLCASALEPAGAHALEAGLQKLLRFPLSARLLREVHAIMLEYDTVPRLQLKVQHQLEAIVRSVYESANRPLVVIASAVLKFATSAPFHDGNKRMCTIFVALLLRHFELLSLPFLLLTSTGDGTVDGFVQELTEQAIVTQQQIKKLLTLQQQHKELLMLRHAPLRALQVLEYMQIQPSVRVQDVASELGVPYQSAANLVTQLQKFNLVKEVTGQKRERRFVYDALTLGR